MFPSNAMTQLAANSSELEDSESVEIEFDPAGDVVTSRVIIAGSNAMRFHMADTNDDRTMSWAWPCSVASLLVTSLAIIIWFMKDSQ